MKTFVLTMLMATAAAAQQVAGAAAQQQPAVDVLDQINAAAQLVDSGKAGEAVTALKAIVAAHPDNWTAQYELALAHSANGDPENCRKILEPLSETGTDMQKADALGMLGNCLDDLGQREKAIAAYRRGLKLNANDSHLAYNLALTLSQLEKFDEARELLKTGTRADHGHASGYLLLARIFEVQGFRVPAVFTYLHFLALEASPRAKDAAAHLQALLNAGVEKTGKGVNLNIDPKSRKEEGDYGPMEMSLALAAGAMLTEEKKPLSDFDKAREQVALVVAMFTEQAGDHDDYTAAIHRPFFAAMQTAKLTDTFAALAVAPLGLSGTEQWMKAHAADVQRYDKWIAPQQARPAVKTSRP
jgi:tetratricopeptide (TPR) repeat protein